MLCCHGIAIYPAASHFLMKAASLLLKSYAELDDLQTRPELHLRGFAIVVVESDSSGVLQTRTVPRVRGVTRGQLGDLMIQMLIPLTQGDICSAHCRTIEPCFPIIVTAKLWARLQSKWEDASLPCCFAYPYNFSPLLHPLLRKSTMIPLESTSQSLYQELRGLSRRAWH